MPKQPKVVPSHVKRILSKARHGRSLGPQLVDLIGHFFQAAGGTKQVALMLYTEFKAARPGSIVRQRIMDLVLRCVRFGNEKNPRGLSLENLGEQDLERELEEVLGEMAEDLGHVKEEEEESAEGRPATDVAGGGGGGGAGGGAGAEAGVRPEGADPGRPA